MLNINTVKNNNDNDYHKVGPIYLNVCSTSFITQFWIDGFIKV